MDTRGFLFKLFSTTLLSATFTLTVSDSKADDSLTTNDFTHLVKLQVSGYDANRSTLENFPVLVRVSTSLDGFAYSDMHSSSDGGDLAFFAEDGARLASEIDTWNKNGESLVWVQLPQMAQGTMFFMCYGTSATVGNPNPWADYVGVWHLKEDGDGSSNSRISVADSSTNHLDGLAYAGYGIDADSGKIGRARCIAIDNDHAYGIVVEATNGVNKTTAERLGTDFHGSFWMMAGGANDDAMKYGMLLCRRKGDQGIAWGFAFGGDNAVGNNVDYMRVFSNNDNSHNVYTTNPIGSVLKANDGIWKKVDVVWKYETNGNVPVVDVYTNGCFVESITHLTQITNEVANIGIGGSTQDNPGNASGRKGRRFNGSMDEVRLRPGATSADWIKADFDTVDNPDFVTIVPPEALAIEWADASGKTGLSHVSYDYAVVEGTVLSLGEAASCSIQYKVWSGDEPGGWSTLASGLASSDAFSFSISPLLAGTTYGYKLRALGSDGVATEPISGTFTTQGDSGEVIGSPYTHFFDDGTNACWVVDGFERYLKFEVTGYTGTETLTNFPVLVEVRKKDTNGFSYDDFYRIDGNDLAFVDEKGHIIPHEIDTWNRGGMSLFWVRLPEMVNGTTFTMCYRSPLLDPLPDPGNTFERYLGVWHMNEKENGVVDVADSTTNNLVGETHAKSLASSEGRIGYARRVAQEGGASSSAGRIIVFDHDNILRDVGPEFTYSGWYKLAKGITDPDWAYLVSRKDDDDSTGWGVQYHDKDKSSKLMRVWAASEGKNKSGFFDITKVGLSEAASGYQHDKWAYWTFVYSNQTFHAYFNGEELYSTITNYTLKLPVVNDSTATVENLIIGGMQNGKGALNGYVDEARYSVGIRSADWIKAEYASTMQQANWNSPALRFVTKGTQVSRGAESLVPVVVWEKGRDLPETVIDVSYAYVQFAGTVTFCGSGANTCDIEYKLWADGDVEPEDWTTLLGSAKKGTKFSIPVFGLKQDMPYNFIIRAVCEVDGQRRSTRDHVGSFRTNGNVSEESAGEILRVANRFVHRFGAGKTYFTTPDYVRSVEILVVGGGGAGGYKVGGGGGGGGVYHSDEFAVQTNTTYVISVGRGGTAATSPATASSEGTGEYSYFARVDVNDLNQTNETVLVSVPGGGGGGNYSSGELAGTGADGASGGGGTYARSGGSPVESGTYGNKGGAGNNTTASSGKSRTAAGGGGGGGRAGLSATKDLWYFGGAGGVGVGSEITGEMLFYGAGGGGGYKYYTDNLHYSGPGGGGSGIGGDAADVRNGIPATSGVAKTGAGGGGGSMTYGDEGDSTYWKGGDGGDGVVMLAYEVHGRDPISYEPRVSMTRCEYDEANMRASIDYRVYWAGVQAYTNDLYVLYSTESEDGVSTNAVANGGGEWHKVGNGLLGIGSTEFYPPKVGHTYWVRLVARKDANSYWLSDEIGMFKVPAIELNGALWTESKTSSSEDYATINYTLFDTNETTHVFCYWSEDESALLGDTPPSGSGVHLLDLGANTGKELSSTNAFTLSASQGLVRNRAYFVRLMSGDENGLQYFLSDETCELDTAEVPLTILNDASWSESNVATVHFNATVGKLDPAQTELVVLYSTVESDVKATRPETKGTVAVAGLGYCSDLAFDSASPSATFPLWSESITNYYVRLALATNAVTDVEGVVTTNRVIVGGSYSAATKKIAVSHAVEANTLIYIVTANPKTGCYGDAIEALDYTGPEYAGLTSGWGFDNKYGLTGELACEATASSLPGTYPITQGDFGLVDGGAEKINTEDGVEYRYQYKLAFSGATYTITNAVFSAEIEDVSHTYNAEAVDTSELVKTVSGNRGDVSFNYRVGTGEWSDTLPAFTNVGNYVVQFKASATGHDDVCGMFNVTVSPAPLYAEISVPDVDYAGRNVVPAITTNVTGLVRGDLNPLTCEFKDEASDWLSEPPSNMHPGLYKLFFRVSAPNHLSYITNCTYEIRDWDYRINLDGRTGFEMPFHVEYPGWLLRNATADGNINDGYAAMDTQEKRNNVLDTVCPNGLKLWQNYVLNREDKSKKLVAAVLQYGSRVDQGAFVVHFPDIAAVEDTGLSVRYRLDRKLKGASEFTPGEPSRKYEMNVPLDGGDPSGLYVLNIVLTPTNETYAAEYGNSVISSCTTIGVMRVASVLTNTVVSVPWYCTTHNLETNEDIQVANVLNPKGLSSGDSLYVYNNATDAFSVWNWSLPECPDRWATNTTVTVNDIVCGTDPVKTPLPRSSAFWLVRHDPGTVGATNYIYLIGRYTGEKHVVELVPGESRSNPGHTLVGNPTMLDIDLNDLAFVDGEGNPSVPNVKDCIVMMDIAGVNKTYYRNANNTEWVHEVWIDDRGRRKRTKVSGGIVPSGTGFWYKRASGEELKIEFPAY